MLKNKIMKKYQFHKLVKVKKNNQKNKDKFDRKKKTKAR